MIKRNNRENQNIQSMQLTADFEIKSLLEDISLLTNDLKKEFEKHALLPIITPSPLMVTSPLILIQNLMLHPVPVQLFCQFIYFKCFFTKWSE